MTKLPLNGVPGKALERKLTQLSTETFLCFFPAGGGHAGWGTGSYLGATAKDDRAGEDPHVRCQPLHLFDTREA